LGRGSPCGAPLGGATGEVLEGRRIVFGSQSLGARARATAGSEGGGGAGSGRQQRGRGLCARAARYAGWTATAWHPKAGPTPIRATRRARVARRRGRVVQRHRAEDKGGRWGKARRPQRVLRATWTRGVGASRSWDPQPGYSAGCSVDCGQKD